MTSALKEKIAGLMPYRSVRLQWKLVEIKKLNEIYELVFETPQGRRLLLVKKIALSLPSALPMLPKRLTSSFKRRTKCGPLNPI